MKAGHASRALSSRQPGIAAYALARHSGLTGSGGPGRFGGIARGGAGGGVTQAATPKASATVSTRRRSEGMEWLLLEALVALALAVFIVWFTMGGKSKAPPGAQGSSEGNGANDEQGRR